MVKRAARAVTKHVYAKVAKPILFKLHPDKVHYRLIWLGRTVQRIPGLRDVPQVWSYNNAVLEQEVCGLRFKNPVGLSAGFDKDIQMARVIRDVGFGFMTGGSITALPCDGNPHPWFYRLPMSKALVVYAGLPNKGVKSVVGILKKYPKKTFNDFPLSVSVAKTNSPITVNESDAIRDYCTSLKLLNDEQLCQIYEINISCPNTYGGEPFTTPERLHRLLLQVDQLKLTKPIFIKMPINQPWVKFNLLLDVIVKHNIQGVTIGNLLKDRNNAKLKDNLPESVKGNLSGEPTRQITTELIGKTYRTYGKRLVIIGVGGIFSADDAYAKIRAGASLVALVTGMIFEGPQLVGAINSRLVRLLKNDGYTSISDAVGVDIKQK